MACVQVKGKPFSQKAKKQQLMDKRQRKREVAEKVAAAATGAVQAPPRDEDFRASLFTSLGKSGAVNQLSTVFVKERKEDVMVRKLTSDIPLDVTKRGQPLHALVMPRYGQRVLSRCVTG